MTAGCRGGVYVGPGRPADGKDAFGRAPSDAALGQFKEFEITSAEVRKDAAGDAVGLYCHVRIRDTARPDARHMEYYLTGAEFSSLPSAAPARRAAITAILKREVKKEFEAWAGEVARRRRQPVKQDVQATFGAKIVTTLANPAP